MTDINPTQAIILAILHKGSAPGAHIELAARKLDGHWNVTRSQVYRELPKLTKLGLLIRLEPVEEVRWHDPYKLTDAGRRAYQNWFTNQKISAITRDPWMLRKLLCEYTGISSEDERNLHADALEAIQASLSAEAAKPKPDPILLSRYQTAYAWFSGSLS